MTENEAIDVLKNLAFLSTEKEHEKCEKAIYMAIQAIEKQSMVNEILHELREYSAIGTIDEFKDLKEKQKNGFFKKI